MGGLGGLISGLVSSGQALPTVDLAALRQTIAGAGQYQQLIINALPAQIQEQLKQYEASNAAAGDTLKTNVTDQGADYMSKVGQIYGPNSDAAVAEKAANRQDIYSTVPGTQDAVRNAMAATGGLARGHAGDALAQPYVQAAQTYDKSAMATNAKQTAQGQQATQAALATVNSMNSAMFQQLFGMSKEQAQTILTTGNQALRDQLAQLISQSATQTNQTLNVEGVAANNGYQNAVTRNAQQAAVAGSIGDMWQQAIMSEMGGMPMPSGGGGGSQGMPAGSDVSSSDYQRNAGAIAAGMGY